MQQRQLAVLFLRRGAQRGRPVRNARAAPSLSSRVSGLIYACKPNAWVSGPLELSQIRGKETKGIGLSCCSKWWAVLGSNQWPLPCETGVRGLRINDMRAETPIATGTWYHVMSLDITQCHDLTVPKLSQRPLSRRAAHDPAADLCDRPLPGSQLAVLKACTVSRDNSGISILAGGRQLLSVASGRHTRRSRLVLRSPQYLIVGHRR